MLRALAKTLLKKTPYRIARRTATNRFEAIEDSLASLASRGYRPKRIIDGGANVGFFTATVLRLFPTAVVHAIEPQPGCQIDLQSTASRVGNRVITHAVALCAPESGSTTITMATDQFHRSTGAHVAHANGTTPHATCVTVPCATLDQLLAPYRTDGDHSLLKFDLQGYELHALRGALQTLATADFVLTEVSFFAQAYEPPVTELISFLSTHGFDLYDICSVFGRPRDNRARQGDFLFIKRNCKFAADTMWD